MKKKGEKIMKKKILSLVLAATVGLLTACQSEGASAVNNEGTGVTTIKFAYRQDSWPTYGVADDGTPTGYDIEVLRLVDEELPEYEFEYIPTSYDDAYVGIGVGTYDAVLTNSFWTPERAEEFVIPEENLGAMPLVLVVRKENEAVKTLEDLYDAGLELAPIMAGNGIQYVVEDYNEKTPDKALTITPSDDSKNVGGAVEWVVEGRADACIRVLSQWENQVLAEDGAQHAYIDQISGNVFDAAKTYPLFSKELEGIEPAFSEALKKVKDSGKASEISTEFYGVDVLSYIK